MADQGQAISEELSDAIAEFKDDYGHANNNEERGRYCTPAALKIIRIIESQGILAMGLLREIVDDASPCASACSRLVDEKLIERAAALVKHA